jgi:hypothetical protein
MAVDFISMSIFFNNLPLSPNWNINYLSPFIMDRAIQFLNFPSHAFLVQGIYLSVFYSTLLRRYYIWQYTFSSNRKSNHPPLKYRKKNLLQKAALKILTIMRFSRKIGTFCDIRVLYRT